jgi:predicted glutamine amidotransferase
MRARRGLGALLALGALAAVAPGRSAEAGPDHACRLWGVIGPAPDPAVLYDQLVGGQYAFRKLADSNHDGWGVAYYAEALAPPGIDRPQLLRAGPPADDTFDPRFVQAAGELMTQDATCAIAHLRAASSGHRDVPDPHPFARGPLALAHNGTLNSTVLIDLLQEGNPAYLEEHLPDYDTPYIDSELYYLYVMKLRESGVTRPDGRRSHRTSDVIAAAALRLYDAGAMVSAANCVVATPDTLYALRFDHLNQNSYRLRYRSISGGWTVASEPVGTDTTGWSSVPAKSLAIFPRGAPPTFTTVYPPAGAWLTVDDTKIDDDGVPPSDGNADGGADAGETVELRLFLKNVGGQTATTVVGCLRCADSLATVTDSVAMYPNIAPGGIAVPLDPFVLRVGPECPNRRVLNLELTVTAGLGGDPQTWNRAVALSVTSPDIGFLSADAWDALGEPLDPGDEGSLRLWLQNVGGENATALQAQLGSASPWVEILQGASGTDTLAVGEADSLAPPYRLRILPGCPNPEVIPLAAALTADWGIADSVTFELPVGGFSDNAESGEGLWTHQAGIPGYVDQWHLSTLRNHTAGGLRSWKCGAADSGAVYARYLDAVLTAPPVPLAIHTELRFWHFIRADLATGHFGSALDGGIVEASINGGPWSQIFPATGYDFVIGEGYPPGPFPPGTPVFAGWWNWRQSIFELDGYTGTVQFRFRFGSDGERGQEGWYLDDIQVLGTNVSSDAAEPTGAPPAPALRVGGPSPFRESTALLLDIPRAGRVDLSILDLEGRVLRHLVQGTTAAGSHRIVWDGRDQAGRAVPSGLYFFRLASADGGFAEVQRVVRVR